ncbi:integrase catalytic domain-containing protein [Trichonephila clavipes]|nr:integrase catalytic domain-containing protein [Trichonephila clavipes]
MPHHGVYRPEKSTTKMRTVFNASSPSTSGKSLNSIQFNGGLVQEDLFSIMVRFRKHKYALTTDIEKNVSHDKHTSGANVFAKNSVEEGHRRANKNVRVNYSNLRHS